MSVLKELQALDELLNLKDGRPLIGGITIHPGSVFITRILDELEKNQRPVCEWQWHKLAERMVTACGNDSDSVGAFCQFCGGKVEVV